VSKLKEVACYGAQCWAAPSPTPFWSGFSAAPPASLNILIADDDALQRELLQGFLEKHGYRVFSAGDGAEAVQLFRREPVQLALLDRRMPGLTGVQVLAEMKAINPLVRAILITAYSAVDVAVRVMQLGADDFLEKPVDLARLLEKIQQVEQDLAVAEDVVEVRQAAAEAPLPLSVIGDSPAMREVFSLVRRVADTPWSVLILCLSNATPAARPNWPRNTLDLLIKHPWPGKCPGTGTSHSAQPDSVGLSTITSTVVWPRCCAVYSPPYRSISRTRARR
jgi:CheY-like chemotaxis protein